MAFLKREIADLNIQEAKIRLKRAKLEARLFDITQRDSRTHSNDRI